MSVQQEVEEFALQSFAVLQSDYHFKPPRIRREGWITWIDFIRDDIAVELEIDWREFDVFLLIVRLDGGKLPPKGRYICDGKKCRIYLLNLIEEKQWVVDRAIVSRIRSRPSDPHIREAGYLKAQIANYLELLLSCISRIFAERSNLFE